MRSLVLLFILVSTPAWSSDLAIDRLTNHIIIRDNLDDLSKILRRNTWTRIEPVKVKGSTCVDDGGLPKFSSTGPCNMPKYNDTRKID